LDLQHFIRTAQRPFLIAGPCSAETEEQVMQTCQQIAASGQASALRAGIWKPRTRPDSFEGLGEEALPWLIEAGKSVGLPNYSRWHGSNCHMHPRK
jgi:chorismate mutase